jgi:tetratricopeptide (TPR) repeat protein
VLLTVLTIVLTPRAGASADAPAPGDVNAIITAYMRDPIRNRAALLALARRSDIDLPPAVTLMAGDAALRAGSAQTAVRRFERVLASGLQDPWLGWTRLALGWIALTREDLPEARAQFSLAVASSPTSRPAAHLALGLLDASERVTGAAEEFAAVENAAGVDPALRDAATLGGAYALYWAGGYDEARMAFRAFSDGNPGSAFADDARYAAAWMAVHIGAWSEALDELAELAESTPGARGAEGTRRDLLNLEPRAIMQAGVHRYRRGSLAPPDRQLAKLLDGDGVRLARAAMRWIGELETGGAAPRDPLTRPWVPHPIVDVPIERAPLAKPAPPVEPAKISVSNRNATSGWRGTVAIVLVAVAVVAAIVLRAENKRRRS